MNTNTGIGIETAENLSCSANSYRRLRFWKLRYVGGRL